jgi:hypothetical protein
VASRRDEFAVVWEEANDDVRVVRMQVFEAHGEPITSSVILTTLRTAGGDPRITATNDGYAVLWAVDRGESAALVVQRTDARGHTLGTPVDAFTSPTARPLAFAHTGDGFVVVWWQWAKEPHVQSATWLDARGQRVSDVELTRMPCDDPTVDLRPGPDGRMHVTWEQQIDNQQHVIVGLLSKERVVRQESDYVGRDPALLRDGVVMTSLSRLVRPIRTFRRVRRSATRHRADGRRRRARQRLGNLSRAGNRRRIANVRGRASLQP